MIASRHTGTLRPWLGVVLAALLGACAPREARAPASETTATTHAATGTEPAPAEHAAPRRVSSPRAESSPKVAAAGATFVCDPERTAARSESGFQRVFDAPVRSFAVGKPPRLALLSGGSAWSFDGKRWTEAALSRPLGDGDQVEIFFGRDNWPRLMGTAGADAWYERLTWRGWRKAPSELGHLGSPSGGLYGVLGHDDPEVVCRPGQLCIVKRVSGWSNAPAHAEAARVVLSGGTAWALHADRIQRLTHEGWTELEPARRFRDPAGVWIEPEGNVWVIERGAAELWRLEGGSWSSSRAPLDRPEAIWGRAASDVWLVGKGGAAHFDGTAWKCALAVESALAFIGHAGDELWLAGDAGVWRSNPKGAGGEP